MSKKLFKHKTFSVESCEIKKEGDGHVIEGYASVFGNVDSYGDRVMHGAFSKTLDEKNRGRDVKFLYQHNSYEPIGVPMEIREDEKGLYFKAMFADTQRAQEARSLAKMGALDGFSIGYRTIKEETLEDDTLALLEIELAEVSLVTFEANTEAKVTNVKNTEGAAQVVAGLIVLGHTPEEAAEFVKNLSLVKNEPCKAHSDAQADQVEAEKAEANEKSRKMQDIAHSLRNLKSEMVNKEA